MNRPFHYLREGELAVLIRESTGKPTPVHCDFGPGMVRLAENADGGRGSAWEIAILERLRGITAEEGAGI